MAGARRNLAQPTMSTSQVRPIGSQYRLSRAREVHPTSALDSKCAFCQQGHDLNQMAAGKFYQFGPHYLHYFCILFSRDGIQRGEDEEGLFGFYLSDINKELKRGMRLRCHFCQKSGATIACGHKKCSKSYHFTCGHAQSCMFRFEGNMSSFCPDHFPKDLDGFRIVDRLCHAGCSERIIKHERCITSPCCRRRYHHACLQSMAMVSGRAHFKCPICSDKEAFAKKCVKFGVYLPEKDASWEDPANEAFYQFKAMERQYLHCDAKNCICAQGRDFHRVGTTFEIIRCEYCGCQGTHIECGGLNKASPNFICDRHQGGNGLTEGVPGQSATAINSASSRDSSDSSESEADEVVETMLAQSQERLSKLKRLQEELLESGSEDDIQVVNEVVANGTRQTLKIRDDQGRKIRIFRVTPKPGPWRYPDHEKGTSGPNTSLGPWVDTSDHFLHEINVSISEESVLNPRVSNQPPSPVAILPNSTPPPATFVDVETPAPSEIAGVETIDLADSSDDECLIVP